MAKKTVCPITRAQFDDNAKAVTIQIGNEKLEAPVKKFSTGSLGWYLNGKIKIEIGGVQVPVQIGLNLTIVGSKELPGEAGAAAGVAAQEDASTNYQFEGRSEP